MERLGYWIIKHYRQIIAAAAVLLVLSAVFGIKVIGRLSLARFEVEGSESNVAATTLRQHFHTGDPNLLLLVTAKSGTVDSPLVRQEGLAVMKALAAQPYVQEVSSYWSRPFAPALRSRDGRQCLIIASIQGNVTEVRARLGWLSPLFTKAHSAIRVAVGGQEEIFRQVGAQSQRDFIRADAIAIPLIIFLLALVFRNVRAAMLTFGAAVFSILVTLAVLRIIAQFTEVSTFALNLTMVLGLGISVDYCLLVVSRYREEFAQSLDVRRAIVSTVRTAGRTVLFSALTVAVSFSALLLFPFFFLRSFAYAGMAVITAGVLAALLVVPALLVVMQHRVVAWGWWKPCVHKSGGGRWRRIAVMVMKRPVVVSVLTVLLLLLLAAPFLRIRFGPPDDRILPPHASSRQVEEAMRQHFLAEEDDALRVVSGPFTLTPAMREAIDQYARRLSQRKGVAQVDALTGSYMNGRLAAPPGPWHARFYRAQRTWLSVVPEEAQLLAAPFDLVKSVRALPAPFAVRTGGAPAIIYDFQQELLSWAPLVAGLIMLATFLLLMLMTGSLVLPLKALLLNMLSLSATFGALVWVFQEGHCAGLLGFTPTGFLETSIPILMFCLAFGLSMDYEVFIMSRIQEAYDQLQDNTQAVARGLEKSAAIVTTASVLLAIAFATFATSEIVLLKMMGVGMTLAVLLDATLIRALLIPAFMRLLGRANWWGPKQLARKRQR